MSVSLEDLQRWIPAKATENTFCGVSRTEDRRLTGPSLPLSDSALRQAAKHWVGIPEPCHNGWSVICDRLIWNFAQTRVVAEVERRDAEAAWENEGGR